MNELIGHVFNFEKTTFPASSELFGQLSRPPIIFRAASRPRIATEFSGAVE